MCLWQYMVESHSWGVQSLPAWGVASLIYLLPAILDPSDSCFCYSHQRFWPGNMVIVKAGDKVVRSSLGEGQVCRESSSNTVNLHKHFSKTITSLPPYQIKEDLYKFALEYPWNESEEMTFEDSVFDQHKAAWKTGTCNRSSTGNYINLLETGWLWEWADIKKQQRDSL